MVEEVGYHTVKMSEYRILTKEEYDKEATYFESEEFQNLGSIRFSNDNRLVLLEQEADKFPELAYEGTYTLAEIKQYLSDNKDDWIEDEDDY